MSSRQRVLASIRDALGPDPHVPDVVRGHRTSSDLGHAEVVALFAERVDDYRAEVHHTDTAGLAATIAAILTASGARRVGAPSGIDPGWLADLGADVEVLQDGADPTGPQLDVTTLGTLDVTVTSAAVGIADTGTIVLDGSPDQGRRALTLVPDHHVCVVLADRIVHTVPEGLARVEPTRPLTMVSGPSATSDIELDRVEGVHGPRTLDVVVVDVGG